LFATATKASVADMLRDIYLVSTLQSGVNLDWVRYSQVLMIAVSLTNSVPKAHHYRLCVSFTSLSHSEAVVLQPD